MQFKNLDNLDLGMKKYAYLAIQDVTKDLGLPLGFFGCNIANLYKRAILQEHDTRPTSTYKDTVVMIEEEWIEECGDPTQIYREVAKEMRYIYQNLCVYWYLNNKKEFDNIVEIEQWTSERQKYNFNDSEVRRNEELKCNEDAKYYANSITLKNNI
ncbi:MAG: hypothetical protein R3Y05_02585 [bacterium]